MSMRIQDALSNCCEGIKNYASASAAWIGKTVTATGAFFTDSAHKVAEYAKTQFENFKTFAQENRRPAIVAAIAFILGAIVTAIITNLFCKATNTPQAAGAPQAPPARTPHHV
jgi:hypothetical protein